MSARESFRRVGISLAAAISGTVAGIFAAGLLFAFHAVESADAPRTEGEAIGAMVYGALFVPWYMLPVWLFVLLPLCLFVPSTAAVCRPSIAAACGAFAAVLVVAAVSSLPGSHTPLVFYAFTAAIAAVSCYTGAALIQSGTRLNG